MPTLEEEIREAVELGITVVDLRKRRAEGRVEDARPRTNLNEAFAELRSIAPDIGTPAPKKPKRPGPSEAEFTKQVIDFARLHGWLVAHFRPGMTKRGRWVTAVQGDGAGFPDLILIRGLQLVAAELKVGRNKATKGQRKWLDAFLGVNGRVFAWVWTPNDWATIERILERP